MMIVIVESLTSIFMLEEEGGERGVFSLKILGAGLLVLFSPFLLAEDLNGLIWAAKNEDGAGI